MFGGWLWSGLEAVVIFGGPLEAKAWGFLENMLAMVFSGWCWCFLGAGVGLLDGKSCFSRLLTAEGRDGGFAAAAFLASTALPNIVGRGGWRAELNPTTP